MTLLELIHLLKRHLKLCIVLPVACALATAVVSWAFLPNTYTSSVSLYVLTRSYDQESSLTNSDLSASQMLSDDVAQLILSNRVKTDTASNLSLKDLRDYKISVASESTTRVITISVTGQSAQNVALVANGLAETTDSVAREVMDVKAVNVIDKAVEATKPSGPNRVMYTAIAFLVGIFLVVAIVVVMDMMNTRVRNAEELEGMLEVPVIGRIPKIR